MLLGFGTYLEGASVGGRNVVKKMIPQSVRSVIKGLLGRGGKRDPFAPYVVPAARAKLAGARYRKINWPSDQSPRIIYGLTPTAALRNVGDQAQVVAIERWFKKHYPSMPVVELDKDVILSNQAGLSQRINPTDLIFLHSGGNLGDRGKWSETARRTMIELFPRNTVVSLPQTIFFSDTPVGRHELAISKRVYGSHRKLTVLGRDQVSGQIACNIFPRATTDTIPDFVLSLKKEDFALQPDPADFGKIMACLRLDDEGVLSKEQRLEISRSLGQPTTLYDTTLSEDIPEERREAILAKTLRMFAGHEAVVTDRYHGLIFSVICRKPTVVLRTVDHKLTSALEWFTDIPNVIFCEDPKNIPVYLARAKAAKVSQYPDFNELYFDRLPELIARKDAEYV